MPTLKNPFRSRDNYVDSHGYAASAGAGTEDDSHKKNSLYGTISKPMHIKSRSVSHEEPAEYKLSEISDSGVFLPPSPPEKKSFWQTRSTSSRTSSYRSVFNENEPFNISRESFDSYRRSFDISARSPVVEASPQFGRQSLDARSHRSYNSGSIRPLTDNVSTPTTPQRARPELQRKPLPDSYVNPPLAPPEDLSEAPEEDEEGKDTKFEDVGLADESKRPKRRGFLSRFEHAPEANATNSENRPGSSGGHKSSHVPFFGRKRGQSGQGAELNSMPQRRSLVGVADAQAAGSPEIRKDT